MATPIDGFSTLPVNRTLHGRSVHRPVNVTGHNVFKGFKIWETNGNVGVGDAVDVFAPVGTPVLAIGGGTISSHPSVKDPSRENFTLAGNLSDGRSFEALYAHTDLLVPVGSQVNEGDTIGRLLSAGFPSHVHFELWINGSAVSAPTPEQLRTKIATILGANPIAPGVILARPIPGGADDDYSYKRVRSFWNSTQDGLIVEVNDVSDFLERPLQNNGARKPIRDIVNTNGLKAFFQTEHLNDDVDRRIYVFFE